MCGVRAQFATGEQKGKRGRGGERRGRGEEGKKGEGEGKRGRRERGARGRGVDDERMPRAALCRWRTAAYSIHPLVTLITRRSQCARRS
jgi:hypothetical protein